MLTFLLFLILILVVAGIVGFVVKGLFWLFVIACVVFVAALITAGYHRGRFARRRPSR